MRAGIGIGLFAVLILGGIPQAGASTEPVGIQLFVAEHCIVADEPFYFPQGEPSTAPDGARARTPDTP